MRWKAMTLATPWNRYQSLTFIAWSMSAARRGSAGVSAGSGNTRSR